MTARPAARPDSARWHRRARHAVRHRLHLRLVLLFLLLALATTVTFVGGMQKAFSSGWRSAARPLVADYVDRLAAEIGSPPSVERARAISARLPVSVRISGPRVNWQSDNAPGAGHAGNPRWPRRAADDDTPLFSRATADGHRVDFGLSTATWQNQPHRAGWATLAVLLCLTALAYLYVRHLLRPLDDIRAGARRFGAGEFGQPIPVRRRDELGELAHDVNAMARDIHRMLDAKRALLLAISHELRSPLTRARLNTELLPDTPEVRTQRDALLRDLAGMRDLVTDLLESERLGQGHAALHLEATDLAALAREVAGEVAQAMSGDMSGGMPGEPAAGPVALHIDAALPASLMLDRARMRLLLRNLLDNALRHSAGAPLPPELHLARAAGDGVVVRVRDHGAGVPEDQLSRLAEPFHRPDAARARATGGVGLGLYLCRLVAQAHGARWQVRNAQPGLEIEIVLPGGRG